MAAFVAAQVSSRTASDTPAVVSLRPFSLDGLDAEAAADWVEESLVFEQALVAMSGVRVQPGPAAAAFIVSGEVRRHRGGLWVLARVAAEPEGFVVGLASFTVTKDAPASPAAAARTEPTPLLQRLMRGSTTGKRRTTLWAGLGTQPMFRYGGIQGSLAGRLDDGWQAGLRVTHFTIHLDEYLTFPSTNRNTTIDDLSTEVVASKLLQLEKVWLPGVGGFRARWAVSAGVGLRWDLFQRRVYQVSTNSFGVSQYVSPADTSSRLSPLLDLGLSWHATRALDLETGVAWAMVEGPQVTNTVGLPAFQGRLALVLRLL
ncbi:MAG: hypothetical protein HYV15_03655 [Elusimicrobia bacterium]|nr:hypothetical protein [Elusimicrobiota bacterium]